MNKTLLHECLTGLLILLWGYAAFSKLLVYDSFRFQLLGHKLLMNQAALVAWLIPTIEIIIAALLIIPQTRKAGLIASFALLFLFTSYIIYMFVFYPHKPCSCGGVISQLSWKQHIVFNIVFTTIAIAALKLPRTHSFHHHAQA